ncbi:restriction system-associated AAA family ATPase [Winogradskyella bathintestinalis]|uniref:Restriction system-associated AAA family ATPase n=1 Tax=Winogradskyella bathintestinalis TaxID=3035208 RepID=A0ABT7ZYH3_9FLAO|nr:restriction system-associated AAA family ATPase [Winogradskyella bathintestinalis]MDN3493793.1 restriction system-associated AAA family ATPase [Winogradskyella bathintestinalis]
MKLVRLLVNSKFRSLYEGFKLDFREEDPDKSWEEFHPFCFAGLNGSGKSNVLEALSNIFYHLECCTLNKGHSSYLKEDFNPVKSDPLAFELEYLIIPRNSSLDKKSFKSYTRVIIRKEQDKIPQISYTIPGELLGKFEDVNNSIRTFLPELIIGYSSGENEILSLPFTKTKFLQFDEYLKYLDDSVELVVDYNLEEKPESSLVFMDYNMSQAILLSNFLLQDKSVLEPIEEQLEIDRLYSFRLVINDLALKDFNDKGEEIETVDSLLPLAEVFIEQLKKCSTSSYKENNLTLLDFYVDDSTKKAFKDQFSTPIKLFRAFQVLLMLNLRNVNRKLKREIYNSESLYASQKIPIPPANEHIFYFNHFKIKKKYSSDEMLVKSFSDGEHQFLHTMGICLMLKDKSALLLLDEPETHFNPDWRSRFISLLKQSLNMSGTNNLMRDILITSHSPFIISDCYPDRVILFEKNKKPKNSAQFNFRTYGTSIDIIMENIFKKNNTIGDLSRKEIENIEEEIKNKKKLSESQVLVYKEKIAHLGDSMEKILLFARLNELKSKK